ncbi:MAG: divalent-cation tolerance protein CutA [Chlorobium phaeobacteroides]|uniref:CutA1 divalent ion tolerance protein n=1 Tax=Chlorobium phaeobacteroides (strain BS1) TaxID=331678 RepID=B3EMT6_CHLPB|nr:divalent-cation tolerance protein CutA [Chlorobium phaeobacteroides]MBL6955974.1 divalent-cation tolerance protein CutA [Chlorobium phaeobacteroides]
MKKTEYCIVSTAVPDAGTAETLAGELLRERLAACIHMQDIRSCYVWENSLRKEKEIVLWIKTLERNYSDIEAFIQAHHPYDLPEIIKVPVTGGLPGYLEWLANSAGGSGSSQ